MLEDMEKINKNLDFKSRFLFIVLAQAEMDFRLRNTPIRINLQVE